MDALIILGAIAGTPVLFALAFRVNGIFLFASVAAGNLLATHVADDAGFTVGMAAQGLEPEAVTRLAMFFLPVVLTLLLMRKTMSAPKLFFHFLPIVATGLMLAVLALPLLPGDLQAQIQQGQYGQIISKSEDVIVGSASVLTMLLTLALYRHKGEKKEKHKKGK